MSGWIGITEGDPDAMAGDHDHGMVWVMRPAEFTATEQDEFELVPVEDWDAAALHDDDVIAWRVPDDPDPPSSDEADRLFDAYADASSSVTNEIEFP